MCHVLQLQLLSNVDALFDFCSSKVKFAYFVALILIKVKMCFLMNVVELGEKVRSLKKESDARIGDDSTESINLVRYGNIFFLLRVHQNLKLSKESKRLKVYY